MYNRTKRIIDIENKILNRLEEKHRIKKDNIKKLCDIASDIANTGKIEIKRIEQIPTVDFYTRWFYGYIKRNGNNIKITHFYNYPIGRHFCGMTNKNILKDRFNTFEMGIDPDKDFIPMYEDVYKNLLHLDIDAGIKIFLQKQYQKEVIQSLLFPMNPEDFMGIYSHYFEEFHIHSIRQELNTMYYLDDFYYDETYLIYIRELQRLSKNMLTFSEIYRYIPYDFKNPELLEVFYEEI